MALKAMVGEFLMVFIWGMCSAMEKMWTMDWVQLLVLPLPSLMTSGELLHHSLPQFPHLKCGDNDNYHGTYLRKIFYK